MADSVASPVRKMPDALAGKHEEKPKRFDCRRQEVPKGSERAFEPHLGLGEIDRGPRVTFD
jgi:hypothetical protein